MRKVIEIGIFMTLTTFQKFQIIAAATVYFVRVKKTKTFTCFTKASGFSSTNTALN